MGVGVAACCCFCVSAFRTSPGREICDRSIFVLISSLSGREDRKRADDPDDSLPDRRRARTFSASCSSSELECVFFSVTPTSVRTSRIALLLTSSSLARSLIRILLIRLFFPAVPLSLHINLRQSVSVARSAHIDIHGVLLFLVFRRRFSVARCLRRLGFF